jgi:peroxiredoxin
MKKILTVSLLLAATCAIAQQNPRVDSLLNEKDSIVVQQTINKLAAGNEEDLGVLLRFYIARKEAIKRDSLLAAIVKQYPNGRHAASTGISKIIQTKGGKQKEEMYKIYRAQFPGSNYNKIVFSIAMAYAEERQTQKVLEYLAQTKGSQGTLNEAVDLIAEQLMKYDSKTAEDLVKKKLDITHQLYLHPDSIVAVNPKYNPRNEYYSFVKLYGAILMQRNDNTHALQYIKEVYDSTGWNDRELVRNYSLLLSRNGQYKKAFGMLDKIVRDGNGDTETKQELVIAYEKLNPGKKGATYLAEAQKGLAANIQEQVAKLLINETAPAFEVKDIHGKTVSLADFKGKTIVLDFWATWCGPCKKSFPAMQQAVNKYSKNENVKFLFIHTWERSAGAQKEAQEYLKENKYTFDLYMDSKDPVSGANPAVTSFGVKGIPAKFVIDGDGHIRFRITGFSGGDDSGAAELSAMIEMITRNKKS